jgi:hypothetical protein
MYWVCVCVCMCVIRSPTPLPSCAVRLNWYVNLRLVFPRLRLYIYIMCVMYLYNMFMKSVVIPNRALMRCAHRERFFADFYRGHRRGKQCSRFARPFSSFLFSFNFKLPCFRAILRIIITIISLSPLPLYNNIVICVGPSRTRYYSYR